MATKTTNLNLILPANNEYVNKWDGPVNTNFKLIDDAVGALQTEILTARGSTTDLNSRLSVSMDSDGNLLPTPEIQAARSSSIYGAFTGVTANLLNNRVEAGDREVFDARQQLTALRDAMAWDADQNRHNSVISSASNYLTFTGPVVSLNGSVTQLIANINGYRQVVRDIKTTTISGGAGTYYLYLDRVSAGTQYLNIVGNTGQTAVYADNGLIAKLSDSSQNFVTLGVKPGDILNITGPPANPNIGRYVVYKTNVEDAVNLTTSELAVIGQFVSANTGLNYSLTDPISPTFGSTSTAHAKTFTRVANRIYVGRCVFDGANVTSITIYQNLGMYAGFTGITLTLGNFSVTVPHNIGYVPNRVLVYGSQANDFSQPLELLSAAEVTGGGSLQRSVIAQMGDLTLSVKNATNGVFYKDFGGTSQTSGYLYVVAER